MSPKRSVVCTALPSTSPRGAVEEVTANRSPVVELPTREHALNDHGSRYRISPGCWCPRPGRSPPPSWSPATMRRPSPPRTRYDVDGRTRRRPILERRPRVRSIAFQSVTPDLIDRRPRAMPRLAPSRSSLPASRRAGTPPGVGCAAATPRRQHPARVTDRGHRPGAAQSRPKSTGRRVRGASPSRVAVRGACCGLWTASVTLRLCLGALAQRDDRRNDRCNQKQAERSDCSPRASGVSCGTAGDPRRSVRRGGQPACSGAAIVASGSEISDHATDTLSAPRASEGRRRAAPRRSPCAMRPAAGFVRDQSKLRSSHRISPSVRTMRSWSRRPRSSQCSTSRPTQRDCAGVA